MDAAHTFFRHFVGELRAAGLSEAQMRRSVWAPASLHELRMLGSDRDLTLARLEPSSEALASVPPVRALSQDDYRGQKLVLVLIPGFTHETLKNYSWHEQIQRANSPHHVVMLHPADGDGPTREQEFARGDGLKLLYVRYPRSNADSAHILPSLFTMLRDSASLQRWISEGRKLVFVGYSYGAPLALELLAALQAGHFEDDKILRNTVAFLGLCGDIGGSYLADDVLRPDSKLLNIRKVIDFCRRHRVIGKLAGLGTPQLLDDMEGGVRALGHERRQQRAREYAPQLPPQLRYYTVSAVMPLADYRRRWWQFNFDDYAMYRQALITDPLTVYNDGQVALPDNLLPATPQLAPGQVQHLGAVRTHHWGVSYRTFNFGINRFPRPAFYRALLRTVIEDLR